LQDVKNACWHAGFVADNRVVFNTGGNRHRLIEHINYAEIQPQVLTNDAIELAGIL